MVEHNKHHLPEPRNVIPPAQTSFETTDEKGEYVNLVLAISTKALQLGDHYWTQFLFKEAHAEYLVSLDGHMNLLKITQDDAKF